jgi:hypothetical protein
MLTLVGRGRSNDRQVGLRGISDYDESNGFSGFGSYAIQIDLLTLWTYTVNPDCTGSAEIDTKALDSEGNVVPGPVIKLKFVLSHHGDTIHTVVASLTLPTGPVPAAIRSDGYKVGKED